MKHRLLNKDKSKIVDEFGQLKIIAKMISDEIAKRKKLIDEFVDDRDTLVEFGATVIDGFRNKYSKRVEYQPKPLDEKNSSRLVRKAVRTSVRELVDIKQAVNLL